MDFHDLDDDSNESISAIFFPNFSDDDSEDQVAEDKKVISAVTLRYSSKYLSKMLFRGFLVKLNFPEKNPVILAPEKEEKQNHAKTVMEVDKFEKGFRLFSESWSNKILAQYVMGPEKQSSKNAIPAMDQEKSKKPSQKPSKYQNELKTA